MMGTVAVQKGKNSLLRNIPFFAGLHSPGISSEALTA
jgi:hypothetical protein